ncbi:uncharacterized protein LOC134841746 [Symsagittifera roscoffensis]|uniref:uncharacterized protein LOC134841746 n=1 Tax=Symsagittifera roscoffensis TaxID=84072 RepID=UPI00307BA4B8
MSGRMSQRGGDAAFEGSLTPNEKILRDVHQLYVDEDNGLVNIARSFAIDLLAPRKKITVLLIGNHSAGKSSFINWYIEEHILKTGVAIETQGFTFVTSGRKRESLQGNASLHLNPYFKPLQEIPGVIENLSTEISTSRNKKFTLVNFLDTPGLTDGDMKYGFDVDQAILWLGKIADLIFVFFDPIGQALCKRTLNIVEELSEIRPERMRFYLSKADEAGPESDRQKVLIQIAQELCKRPSLNKAGFEMPTIYVPGPNTKSTRCVNQIEDVCKDIEKTINLTIQNTLDQLDKDCDIILDQVQHKLDKDGEVKSRNSSANFRAYFLWTLSFLPLVLWGSCALDAFLTKKTIVTVIPLDYYTMIEKIYLIPTRSMISNVIADYNLMAACVAVCIVLFLLGAFIGRSKPTLKRKQIKDLNNKRNFILENVKPKKDKYYQFYLKQCVSHHDN